MTTDLILFDRYCQAYAKGIIQFLISGKPQTVFFKRDERRFDHEGLDVGMSPTDVTVWIADNWSGLLGPIATSYDPTSEDFDPDVLEQELTTRLKLSREATAYYEQAIRAHSDA